MSFDLYLTKEPFTDMHSKHSLWNSGFLSVTQCNKRLFHRETQRTDGVTQRKEHLRPKDPVDETLCSSVSLSVIKDYFTDMRSKHSLWNSVFLGVTPCNKRLFHRETQRTDGATQRKEHLRPKDPADGTLCFSVSLRVIKGHLKEWKKPIIEKEKLHGKQNDPASGRQP